MLASLAIVVAAALPLEPVEGPKARNAARPLVSWTAPGVRLDLYQRGDCVMTAASAGISFPAATSLACRWEGHSEKLTVYSRNPLPRTSGALVGEFRVIESGRAIELVGDPRVTLRRSR